MEQSPTSVGKYLFLGLLLIVAAGFAYLIVPSTIAWVVAVTAWTIVLAFIGRLAIWLVTSVAVGWTRVQAEREAWLTQRELTLQEQERAREAKAKADLAALEAQGRVVVAQANQAVYLLQDGLTNLHVKPLHLNPGLSVNGLPTELSPLEVAFWQWWNQSHGSRIPSSPTLASTPLPGPLPVQGQGLPDKINWLQLLPQRRGDLHRLGVGGRARPNGGIQTGTISLYELFHTIIAAATGWGKSGFARSLLAQLATCQDEVEMVLIDQQDQGFSPFRHCARLRYPILRSPEEISSALSEIYEEAIKHRAPLLDAYDADDLFEYNQRASTYLPPIIVGVEEAASLLEDKEIGTQLQRQAWELRKFGVYQILLLTSAKGTTIDTAHRDQFSSKLQLHVNSKRQAKMLIDAPEAEEVTSFPAGRAVIELPQRSIEVIQTPYISKAEVRALVSGRLPAPDPARPPIPKPQPDDVQQQILNAINAHIRAGRRWSRSSIAREVLSGDGGNQIARVTETLALFSNHLLDPKQDCPAP